MTCEYRIRDGIVLESILGIYVLISTEAALDQCDYVRRIEDIVAYYWEMMEEGLSVDEMADKASELFKDIGKEELKKDIQELMKQLKEYGYLLSDEEMMEEYTGL